MIRTIVICAAAFALLCTAPAGAQTKKELKLYDRIMNSWRERGALKRLAKLQNEDLLTRIALENGYTGVKIAAVEKINSRERLIEIGTGKPFFYERFKGRDSFMKAVLKKIENEDDLFLILVENPSAIDFYYREREQRDYPDLSPGLAGRLAKLPDLGGNNTIGRKIFLIDRYIDDQNLLYEIFSVPDQSNAVCRSAVEKLTDQKLLAEVVKNNVNTNIREAAIKKITDQSLLADIAKTHEDEFVRIDAIREITDQNIIADIAKTDKNASVRTDAIMKITDQNLLMDISAESDDQPIRRMAFSKLDTASLERIAASRPKGDPMAVAARVVAKTSDWNAEITNTRQQIGDVIGAMALVPQEAKPTVDNIVDACHLYIRRGDEAKIPDLGFLLDNYGDMRLAEDYLNCGNQRLYEIGASWARRHGYNIGAGVGSARARWGSQR